MTKPTIIHWTLIALLLVGLVSCQEDHEAPEEDPIASDHGDISVDIAGEDFLSQFESRVRIATAIECFAGNMSMIATYYNNAGFERADIAIFNIPIALGTHKIHRIESASQVCDTDTVYASFGTSLDDGDVGGDSYFTSEEAGNQITITSLNPEAQEVKGNFDVMLVVTDEHRFDRATPQVPDTVRFTNGQFRARYEIVE